MTLPREDLSRILENLREQNGKLEAFQRRLAELTVTVTSANNLVRVTVKPKEGLTDLRFLNLTYRALSPEQLADLVLATIREADRQLRTAVLDDLPDFPIEGVSSEQILSGEVSFIDALPVEELLRDVSTTLFGEDGR